MKHIKITCVTLIVLLGSVACFGQRQNRLNQKGERRGKWVVYHDSNKQVKSFEGRFRNGAPVGKAWYYNASGDLLKKERNGRRKLKTTLFYPGAGKRMKGKARIAINDTLIRYFYQGKWKYYDRAQKLSKIGYFEKGRLVRTVQKGKGPQLNDSLVRVLQQLEIGFNTRNEKIIRQIGAARFNAMQKENFQKQLYKEDSLTFAVVAALLSNGYPTKDEAGDAVSIPFYILSFAPADIKENYLATLESATLTGDLDRKSLAFFVDKMRVGQGRLQKYGTQWYFDAHNVPVYYRSEDEAHLIERRKNVGIE